MILKIKFLFMSYLIINFKKMNYKILLIFFLFFGSFKLTAQQVGDFCILTTKDGNNYKGEVVQTNDSIIVIQNMDKEKFTISHSYIKNIKITEKAAINSGEAEIHSSASSRYFFGPSSFNLRKNEAYYQNFWVFYNHFSYGISDRFTIGTSIIPLFLFNSPTPISLSLKYSVPIAKNVNWGVGALGYHTIGFEDFLERDKPNGILGYTTLTLGNPKRNLTLGYGVTSFNNDLLSLSFNLKLSKKFYLMSENYISTDSESVLSLLGVRYMAREVNFDFGIIRPLIEDVEFIGIPIVAVTLPMDFNKNSKASKINKNSNNTSRKTKKH
jgi:hypothetical protein